MELRSADDLTVIKGIGVKSASVLNAAGITTFAQLAVTPTDYLREILRAANLRLVDPETWPDQAQALI
jgi:predicted flap endonuclease-1-like 5' DNA nuclease